MSQLLLASHHPVSTEACVSIAKLTVISTPPQEWGIQSGEESFKDGGKLQQVEEL